MKSEMGYCAEFPCDANLPNENTFLFFFLFFTMIFSDSITKGKTLFH